MPGHDHHLNFVFQPGDLNTEAAVFNWFCPVKEDNGEDITVLIKMSVLLYSFYLLTSSQNIPFSFSNSFVRLLIYISRLFGDFERRMTTIETKKTYLETSAVRELFGPDQCEWTEILRYRRKIHL